MLKIGSSMDIHRLIPNRKLILGGVELKSKVGSLAHSDGDVVYHAICEAIIGALGLGDLGDHFPSSNQKYKDYDSSKFVIEANKLLKSKKYKISNLDVSIILESPKLGSTKLLIKKNIAKLLNLKLDQVNVKAGTMEKIGEIGKNKAVLAFATVLIMKEG